jgi:hypothetical protein
MTPIRRQVLEVLAQLSELHPDMRIGQLVENGAMWAKGPEEGATWDVEDEEFLGAAREHVEQWLQRLASGPEG